MDILKFIQDNTFLLGLLIMWLTAAFLFILQVRDMKKERDEEKKRSQTEKEQIEKSAKEEREQAELRRKEEKEKMEGKIHELRIRLEAMETNRIQQIDRTQKEQGDLLLTIKGDIKGMDGTINARLDGIDKVLKLMQEATKQEPHKKN